MPFNRILPASCLMGSLLALVPVTVVAQPSYSRTVRQADGSEPAVPGFGNQIGEKPVLGFGDDAEERAYIISEDYTRAEERLRRYDRNRDGLIDRGESRDGRWYDDPFVWVGFDRSLGKPDSVLLVIGVQF